MAFQCLAREWAVCVKVLDVLETNISDFLSEYPIPERVTNDRELMIRACSKHSRCINHAGATLRADRLFVDAVLGANPFVLSQLPQKSHRLFPDLVARTLPSIGQSSSLTRSYGWTLMQCMPSEFWNDRGFVEEWLRAGLPFGDGTSTMPWIKTDREMILLGIAYCRQDILWRSFSTVAMSLRGERDFMTEVINRDGSFLFAFVSTKLSEDHSLAIQAFSTSKEAVERFLQQKLGETSSQRRSRNAFAGRLAVSLFTKMESYQGFFEALRGMSAGSTDHSGCHLWLLDQGMETSMVYKRLLAEYLDVPNEEEFRQIRLAQENTAYLLATAF